MIHVPLILPVIGTTLKTDLVSVWEFDETTGSTAFDAHSSNDGAVNAIIDQAGILNRCYQYVNPDYVEWGDTDDFSFTDGNDLPFSISLWMNPANTTGNKWIWNKRGGSDQLEYQFYMIGNELYALLYSEDNAAIYLATYVASMTTGWQHIVFTYDGNGLVGGLKTYRNTVLQSVTDASAGSYVGMANGDSVALLGAPSWNPVSNGFVGYIDQTAIWKNRGLDQTAINVLNNSMNGLAYVNW